MCHFEKPVGKSKDTSYKKYYEAFLAESLRLKRAQDNINATEAIFAPERHTQVTETQVTEVEMMEAEPKLTQITTSDQNRPLKTDELEKLTPSVVSKMDLDKAHKTIMCLIETVKEAQQQAQEAHEAEIKARQELAEMTDSRDNALAFKRTTIELTARNLKTTVVDDEKVIKSDVAILTKRAKDFLKSKKHLS